MLFLKEIIKKHKKICYVSLKSPYQHIKEEMLRNDLPLTNFCFIDIFSNYCQEDNLAEHCVFLERPSINEVKRGIEKITTARVPTLILFDNISSLLNYNPIFEIDKLTHHLKEEKIYENVEKIYLMENGGKLLEEDSAKLQKDLTLFMDKIIDY